MALRDMRLDVDFIHHPKIRKLIRRTGLEGFYSLIALYSLAAKIYTKGLLKDCNPQDIEDMCDWNGDANIFVNILLELKLLDQNEEGYSIHDWKEHQGFVFHTEERSQRARDAANARWNKGNDSTKQSENASSMPDACGPHPTCMLTACQPYADSNAPSPSPPPSPSPFPSPKKEERKSSSIHLSLSQRASQLIIEDEKLKQLVADYGKEPISKYVDKCIKYREEKGYGHKDVISTIRSWAIEDGCKITSPMDPYPTHCEKCGSSLVNGICEPCGLRVYSINGKHTFENIDDTEKMGNNLKAFLNKFGKQSE